MTITVRTTEPTDREMLIHVESLSTPGLSYVPNVFDIFLTDPRGEFLTAEMDGQVVACGKFTVLPDQTAWLETLRVIPARQGMGIGKRFYDRFFELAAIEKVSAMRMYTGLTNFASKGLAESYGFSLEESFAEARLPILVEWAAVQPGAFEPVIDPERAVSLIMPQADVWNGFLVMNRTFYRITPALCRDFTLKGFIFEDRVTGSLVILGARFMPEQALHIGLYSGDLQACIGFAKHLGARRGAGRLNWMFPASLQHVKTAALENGFQLEKGECIVMRVDVPIG